MPTNITPTITITVTFTPTELEVLRMALKGWDGWDGKGTIDDETDTLRYDLFNRLNNI